MNKQHFHAALAATLKHEGIYSADQLDPGGQTYFGISRVYWPTWPGWLVIDEWLRADRSMPVNLTEAVENFYYVNFWCRVQGDLVAALSPAIAMELFDTAVNMGAGVAIRFLQTALNVQNDPARYPDLIADGQPGQKTLAALARIVGRFNGNRDNNETILLNCLNGEQYIAYKNNPHHRYFRGWFARV